MSDGVIRTGPGWRSTNLGARLFAASGRAIAVKLAAVHAAGFTDITVAQLALFHVLDPGGTRLTTLARQAGLSKPSMTELVDRAESAGLVTRHVDLNDARGRIVVATTEGVALLAALAAGVVAANDDVSAVIGVEATARLGDRLGRYITDGEVVPAPETNPDWTANVGRLFALAAARVTAEVAAAVAARGFAASPAVLGMIRHLALDGSRLTDLAAAARMTKPAMRELVDRGEALGFVVRGPDPTDRRARTIAFAPAGLALLEAARRSVVDAEMALAAKVGADTLADIRRSLARLAIDDVRDAA